MAEEYVLGTAVWFEATFTSKDTGEPVDPLEVTAKVWQSGDKAADVETFTLSGGGVGRVKQGVYRVQTNPTRGGRINCEFIGTGPVGVAGVEYAIIRNPQVPT